MVAEALSARIFNPEHTGENRCYPCTIVNIVITFGCGLIIGHFGNYYISGLLIVTGLVLIYIRGYLVPGTPSLAQILLPKRLFSLLPGEELSKSSNSISIEIESHLQQHSILEASHTGEDKDFQLHSSIKTRWVHLIRSYQMEEAMEQLQTSVEASDDMEFFAIPEGYIAMHKGKQIGRWESKQAFLIHMSSFELLDALLPRWDCYRIDEKNLLSVGLRLFTPICPCGSDITEGMGKIRTCCGSKSVYKIKCQETEIDLLEVDASQVSD